MGATSRRRREIVYICEGEKDVDRLHSLGFFATTNPGGCRLGWKPGRYNPLLRGLIVVILPDNDRPGIRRAEEIERSLLGRFAARVLMLKLPRLRQAEDVSDWLDFRDGTKAELIKRTKVLLGEEMHGAPKNGGKGGGYHRQAVFACAALTANERLLLLAIQHYSGESRLTAADLGMAMGLHRVTVQRLISALTKRSILSRERGRLVVHWDEIV